MKERNEIKPFIGIVLHLSLGLGVTPVHLCRRGTRTTLHVSSQEVEEETQISSSRGSSADLPSCKVRCFSISVHPFKLQDLSFFSSKINSSIIKKGFKGNVNQDVLKQNIVWFLNSLFSSQSWI